MTTSSKAAVDNAAQTSLQDAPGRPITQDSRVVIIGAGCFGLSTAYHLLMRGYTDITILDRSSVLPAPDASSNDINRSECLFSLLALTISLCRDDTLLTWRVPVFQVVRSSYSDKFYAALAREAMDAWKVRKFWGDTYHE
jgi:sarcosine oxidase/L-pipecolate oxidase